MNRTAVAALAAFILAGPLESAAASTSPLRAQPRDSVCYRAPDLNDMCVRFFAGVETRIYANGVRSVVVPFVMRTPAGEYINDDHFFEADCAGRRVVGTAFRDDRGTRYDAHAEPWEMLDHTRALAQAVCDWEDPRLARK